MKRIAFVALISLGLLALAYNVLIKDEPTVAVEPLIRLGFLVLLLAGGGYEVWKRRKRSRG